MTKQTTIVVTGSLRVKMILVPDKATNMAVITMYLIVINQNYFIETIPMNTLNRLDAK